MLADDPGQDKNVYDGSDHSVMMKKMNNLPPVGLDCFFEKYFHHYLHIYLPFYTVVYFIVHFSFDFRL